MSDAGARVGDSTLLRSGSMNDGRERKLGAAAGRAFE